MLHRFKEIFKKTLSGWLHFVEIFSKAITLIAVTIAFFSIFLVYSGTLRLLGKDLLRREIKEDEASYWEDSVVGNRDLEDFTKQY